MPQLKRKNKNKKIGLSRKIKEKIQFLEGDDDIIRLAPALLKLLNARQITDRISEILKKLFKQNLNRKKTIFSMCYLSITGIKLDDINISDVADNTEILSYHFVGTPEFKQIFNKHNYGYSLSYSFAQYILSESGYFTGIEISDYLLDIVNRLGNSNIDQKSPLYTVVRDSLRFHVVESIVPKLDKKIVMQNYYEKLKSVEAFGHRLLHDPNYWMQYAMAKMMCYNYEDAQTYLETAYWKAEYLRKNALNGVYNTNKIDNQQAHLYLLMAQDKKYLDSTRIYDFFMKADSKLHSVPADRFLLHRINDMISVFKEKSSLLSKRHLPLIKSSILRYCEKLEDAINNGSCIDVTQGVFKHLKSNINMFLQSKEQKSC